MHTIAEDATLCVIAGFDEFQCFAPSQHFVFPTSQASKILICDIASARVTPNQLGNRRTPIALDKWKDLFRNRKNVTAWLLWKAIVKHTNFTRSFRITLRDQRGRRLLHILSRLLLVAD